VGTDPVVTEITIGSIDVRGAALHVSVSAMKSTVGGETAETSLLLKRQRAGHQIVGVAREAIETITVTMKSAITVKRAIDQATVRGTERESPAGLALPRRGTRPRLNLKI
jgi:hypothetical protein